MARNRKQRRQSHGAAWHWPQTHAWYFTQRGTKKRVPLFDEQGERIRGKENKKAAREHPHMSRVAAAADCGLCFQRTLPPCCASIPVARPSVHAAGMIHGRVFRGLQ